jgi:hypothetical protein
MKKQVLEGSITPIKVARGAPGVCNLMFADDSLLFFKATKEEARAIDSTLRFFKRCTGQLVSPSKCSILFSNACPSEVQQEIKAILGVASSTFEEKYLGLATPEGRMKSGQFQPILKRFTKRLTNWAERYMSHGAKDTLIRSVAQSLPGHIMAVFKMSMGFCDQYEKLIRDFFWGDEENHRKVHWSSWDNLTKSKGKGGLGYRDMHLLNQALLARQAWRMIQNPSSLCARVLKARYFPHGNMLDTVFSSDPSPVWKGIEFGLDLLKMGIIKRIGNGRSTQFLRDQWLPRDKGLKITAIKKNSRKRWVSQLIKADKTWDLQLLQELFFDHDAQAIASIELPNQDLDDRVAWHPERNGIFTVKSAYKLALSLKHQHRDCESNSGSPDGERALWNCIWKTEVAPKVRIFAWRLATDSLPTRKNKHRRTLEPDSRCTICGHGEEDAHHATVRCTKAKALRTAMREHWSLPAEDAFNYTGKDWLLVCLNQADNTTRSKIILTLWRAWHLRNDVIHEKGLESIARSVAFLKAYTTDPNMSAQPAHDHKGKGPLFAEFDPSPCTPLPRANSWSPPPPGWIKLNSDASFISQGCPSGAGAVARNHDGEVVLAACSLMLNCSDAEDAEAKAALKGISLLVGSGHEKIILEMDCSRVVAAMSSPGVDRSMQ